MKKMILILLLIIPVFIAVIAYLIVGFVARQAEFVPITRVVIPCDEEMRQAWMWEGLNPDTEGPWEVNQDGTVWNVKMIVGQMVDLHSFLRVYPERACITGLNINVTPRVFDNITAHNSTERFFEEATAFVAFRIFEGESIFIAFKIFEEATIFEDDVDEEDLPELPECDDCGDDCREICEFQYFVKDGMWWVRRTTAVVLEDELPEIVCDDCGDDCRGICEFEYFVKDGTWWVRRTTAVVLIDELPLIECDDCGAFCRGNCDSERKEDCVFEYFVRDNMWWVRRIVLPVPRELLDELVCDDCGDFCVGEHEIVGSCHWEYFSRDGMWWMRRIVTRPEVVLCENNRFLTAYDVTISYEIEVTIAVGANAPTYVFWVWVVI
jgi:hypothetical protein